VEADRVGSNAVPGKAEQSKGVTREKKEKTKKKKKKRSKEEERDL